MIWQIQAGIASLLSTSVTLVHVVSAQDMKTDYLRMEKTAVELVIELSAAVDNTRRHYHDVLTFGRAAEGVDERTTLPHVWETFLMKDSHYYFDSIRVELYPDDQEAPQEFQTLLDGATIAETRTAKLFYLNQSFADASFVYQGCPETSPFCLHLVWNTRDGSDYWLEKLEMHPHLVSSHFETRLDLVSPSPMIHQGNSTVWTLYGADEANDTGKLWFQLNLRERYTEARQVVDVRANQLNPQQMRATVTLMSMNGTKTLSFESRILNGKEFSLYIDIDKDNNTAPLAYGSAPCQHCQELMRLCEKTYPCNVTEACVNNRIPPGVEQHFALNGSVGDMLNLTQSVMTCGIETPWEGWVKFASVMNCYMRHKCPLATHEDKMVVFRSHPVVQRLEVQYDTEKLKAEAFELGMKFGKHESRKNITAFTPTSELVTFIQDTTLFLATVDINVAQDATSTSWDISLSNFLGPLPHFLQAPNVPSGFNVTYPIPPTGHLIYFELMSYSDSLEIPGLPPNASTAEPCETCMEQTLSTRGCMNDSPCLDLYSCLLSDTAVDDLGDFFEMGEVDEKKSWNQYISACGNFFANTWKLLRHDAQCFAEKQCSLTKYDSTLPTEAILLMEASHQVIRCENCDVSTDLTLTFGSNSVLAKSGSVTIRSSSTAQEIQASIEQVLQVTGIHVLVEMLDDQTLIWTLIYQYWLDQVPDILVSSSSVDAIVSVNSDTVATIDIQITERNDDGSGSGDEISSTRFVSNGRFPDRVGVRIPEAERDRVVAVLSSSDGLPFGNSTALLDRNLTTDPSPWFLQIRMVFDQIPNPIEVLKMRFAVQSLTLLPMHYIRFRSSDASKFDLRLFLETETMDRETFRKTLIYGDAPSDTTALASAILQQGVVKVHPLSVDVDVYADGFVPPLTFEIGPDGKVILKQKIEFVYGGNTTSTDMSELQTCPFLYCTHFQLNVTHGDHDYYLESIETKEAVGSPTFPVLTGSSAPVLRVGQVSVWTFYAQSGDPRHLDLVFHLREIETNSSLSVLSSSNVIGDRESSASVSINYYESQKHVRFNKAQQNRSDIILFIDISDKQQDLPLFHPGTNDNCKICEQKMHNCESDSACSQVLLCLDRVIGNGTEETMLQEGEIGDRLSIGTNISICATDPMVHPSGWSTFRTSMSCMVKHECSTGFATGREIVLKSFSGMHRIEINSLSEIPIEFQLQAAHDTTNVLIFSLEAAFSIEDLESLLSQHIGNQVSVNLNYIDVPSPHHIIDFEYLNHIGQLPLLSLHHAAPGVEVSITTLALPDVALVLRPDETVQPVDRGNCSSCLSLAYDRCFRDLECLAMYQCIATEQLESELMEFFNSAQVNETFELTDQINQCHSSETTETHGWRMLSDISSCYASSECSVTDHLVNVTNRNVQWEIPPIHQTIHYDQYIAESELTLQSLVGGSVHEVTFPANASADQVKSALESLLALHDVTVTRNVIHDTLEEEIKSIEWDLIYHHWAGHVPVLVGFDTTGFDLRISYYGVASVKLRVH